MITTDFEVILNQATKKLNEQIKTNGVFTTSKQFEDAVRITLKSLGLSVNLNPPAQEFPDIVLDEFGVEVKFTENDTWRSIANSISESDKAASVRYIYLVFGKMGGVPEVRWGKYEDCVIHVRTSHVPRFEVEVSTNPKKSLFSQFGISYDQFSKLPIEKKMEFVRKYARSRLKKGEHFWWLEDKEEPEHSLPLEVKIYMNLPQDEKRRLRAEAALLCPQIVKSSRSRDKYADAVSYLLTYRGVLCPQARDLFSAGSVAMRNGIRGGNYIQRALADIEKEMLLAAEVLEDGLFVEYWGESVQKGDRIKKWLEKADKYASGWTPSQVLFKDNR
jgi:hypothetical protein